MLQFFRNFFKSKIGIVVTLAFLGLIAFAFASSDVANTGTFGGISGGDRVAIVGDRKIGAGELSINMTNALEQARQENPRLNMQAYIAGGGLDGVIQRMLERSAMAEFGREYGLRTGDRLIDSELLEIQAFRGADGSFNEEAFRATLRQRGLTEATVREDLSMGLFARQLVTPISLEARIPRSFALRYATLLRETRAGGIALLPSAAFAPEGNPTDKQLQDYYRATSTDYIRPERRVIRYAAFGEEELGELRAPSEAEIRARFERDKAAYAAREDRVFTQLVAPTQAAAQAIAAEVRGGTSLAASARGKGLATTRIGPVSQQQLSTAASVAVARAGFAAATGAVAEPARGGLGWYVLQVEAIDARPAKTLDQVRTEIAGQLSGEQRRAALADFTARIDDEFADGTSLSEVAEELGLKVQNTPPLTADGRIYGTANQMMPQELAPVLSVAFEMGEGEPQLAEVVPGTIFLVFDVPEITQSATAPLAEIRDDVAERWRRNEGSKAARAAADRVIARAGKGAGLPQALAAEKVSLPPVDAVNLSRDQISQQGRVPPVMALLFSMAEGTVKKLEMPNDTGWFVLKLDDIEPGDVAEDDPIIAQTMAQLGQVASEEYVEQFLAAIQREMTIERNQVAIDAVSAQLTGQQNN